MNTLKTVGERIKKARKNKGLTQTQLGEIICKSESTIRKYESNKVSAPLEILINIAKALDVELSELLPTENIFAGPGQYVSEVKEKTLGQLIDESCDTSHLTEEQKAKLIDLVIKTIQLLD